MEVFVNIYRNQDGKIEVESVKEVINELCKKIECVKINVDISNIATAEIIANDAQEVLNVLKTIGISEKFIIVNRRVKLTNLLKFTKRGKIKYICPMCGSNSIATVSLIGFTPPLYKCKDCGYIGRLILEVDA